MGGKSNPKLGVTLVRHTITADDLREVYRSNNAGLRLYDVMFGTVGKMKVVGKQLTLEQAAKLAHQQLTDLNAPFNFSISQFPIYPEAFQTDRIVKSDGTVHFLSARLAIIDPSGDAQSGDNDPEYAHLSKSIYSTVWGLYDEVLSLTYFMGRIMRFTYSGRVVNGNVIGASIEDAYLHVMALTNLEGVIRYYKHHKDAVVIALHLAQHFYSEFNVPNVLKSMDLVRAGLDGLDTDQFGADHNVHKGVITKWEAYTDYILDLLGCFEEE